MLGGERKGVGGVCSRRVVRRVGTAPVLCVVLCCVGSSCLSVLSVCLFCSATKRDRVAHVSAALPACLPACLPGWLLPPCRQTGQDHERRRRDDDRSTPGDAILGCVWGERENGRGPILRRALPHPPDPPSRPSGAVREWCLCVLTGLCVCACRMAKPPKGCVCALLLLLLFVVCACFFSVPHIVVVVVKRMRVTHPRPADRRTFLQTDGDNVVRSSAIGVKPVFDLLVRERRAAHVVRRGEDRVRGRTLVVGVRLRDGLHVRDGGGLCRYELFHLFGLLLIS